MTRSRWLLLVVLPLAPVLAGAVVVAGAGCTTLGSAPRHDRGSGGKELIGLVARLSARSGPALTLAVDGAAAGRRAIVLLDLASPLTRASTACFGGPPTSHGSVRFRRPSGAAVTLQEAWLDGIEVGDRHLGRRLVAVEPVVAVERAASGSEDAECEVWLGTDALARVALDVDLPAGTVTFSGARPRSAYPGAIDLDRDPTTDRLLVPARLHFGDVQLSAPFLLSTAEVRSTIGGKVVAAAGLPGAAAHGPTLLELAPGAGLRFATLLARHDWTSTAAAGELGADVWGRFKLRIDVGALVMVLVRPTTIEADGQPVCASPEPACLSVRAERAAPGHPWRVSVSAGRDLPGGAMAWLELRRDGSPLPCRAAFSLWPSDRGTSLAVELPSPGLREAGCDGDLQAATSIALAAVDESGPEPACPGECVLLERPGSRDLAACQCSPFGSLLAPPVRAGAARREEPPEEPEPEDP